MQLDSIELYQITIPLKRPYGPPQYRQTALSSILARVWVDDQCGWGEVSIPLEPRLSDEWTEDVFFTAQTLLAPLWLGEEFSLPSEMTEKWSKFQGANSAKYLLECALLDACSMIAGKSAVQYLYPETPGGFDVTAPKASQLPPLDVYISYDQEDDFDAFYNRVAKAVTDGFNFFELKIRPGWDFSMVNALWSALGESMFFLSFDGALSEEHSDMLYRFRDFMPILYDQPFSKYNLSLSAQMCESLKIPFGMTDGLSNPDMLGIAVEARAADLYGFNPQRVGGWIKTKSQLAQCKQFNVGARVWSELTTPLGQRQMYALASQANNRMFGFGCEAAQAEGPGYNSEQAGFEDSHNQSGADLVRCGQPSRFPVPWFDANDWLDALLFPADQLEKTEDGFQIRLSDAPGWGLEPDMDVLDDLTEQSFEIS